MERKNINSGFKTLRVRQDAVSLYTLACKIFIDFPFELKKVAANCIDAADPMIGPNCAQPLTLVGAFFGNWNQLQYLFERAGKDSTIAPALLRAG